MITIQVAVNPIEVFKNAISDDSHEFMQDIDFMVQPTLDADARQVLGRTLEKVTSDDSLVIVSSGQCNHPIDRKSAIYIHLTHTVDGYATFGNVKVNCLTKENIRVAQQRLVSVFNALDPIHSSVTVQFL